MIFQFNPNIKANKKLKKRLRKNYLKISRLRTQAGAQSPVYNSFANQISSAPPKPKSQVK